MRVGNDSLGVLGDPLKRAGGRLLQLPFEAEEVLEEEVAPLGRRLGPSDFDAAADSVRAKAGAEVAGPAEALLFEARGFRTLVEGDDNGIDGCDHCDDYRDGTDYGYADTFDQMQASVGLIIAW